ncbi:MAG: CGNR zinc finger domain-containing protein [Phyllobacteriaceae bacterium]|nr:CGNR zinc finger domain-containing protein [Phyllobacteriaceae bacterium]
MTRGDDGTDDGETAGARAEFREGFPFVGGAAWIDFVDTRPLDPAGRPIDLIATPEALATWARLAEIPLATAPTASDHPRALALRDALRDLFETTSRGEPPEPAAAAVVEAELERVRLAPRLAHDGGDWRLDERLDGDLCGALALDFARFVCEVEPQRLKHCANPACSMVFHDVGKNNRRRWCTMSVCGNRDKVARFRARHARPT